LFFGGFAGILAGLFGLGGGLVLVPFLYWLFSQQGFDPELIMLMAVATSLATIIVTSSAAVLTHHRLRAVLWPLVCYLAPGVFVGAITGAVIADYLNAETLKSLFAFFMLYVGLKMAFPFRSEAKKWRSTPVFLMFSGSLIGFVSTLIGIGGGTLTVPMLTKCGYPMRNAAAVSSACGLPIAMAGTFSYAFLGWSKSGLPDDCLGYVYLPAFAAIIAASMVMAPAGARLANKLPAQLLKRYFAIVLLLVAARMLWG